MVTYCWRRYVVGDGSTESHRLYSSMRIIKELELGKPPPPYACKYRCTKQTWNLLRSAPGNVLIWVVYKLVQKENEEQNKSAKLHYLSNFRCIGTAIYTPQAHFKIVPLHVNNCSNRPVSSVGKRSMTANKHLGIASLRLHQHTEAPNILHPLGLPKRPRPLA